MILAAPPQVVWDAVQLAERFGPIPLNRICTDPLPGLGTEDDVIRFCEHEDRLFELVEGVLVEKSIGTCESMLAVEIAAQLRNYVKPRKLGTVLDEGGLLRLAPGLVRIPDTAFLSIERFPRGRFPAGAIASLAPDIAVEVLSQSNTRKEMSAKLHDYFAAGAGLVWYVDPERRTVQVFTSEADSRVLTERDALDGGDVLPGFELNLHELFSELRPE